MARQTIQEGDNDPRHGTVNGYNNLLCRCAKCTKAWKLHRRKWLEERNKTMPPCENCGVKPAYAKGICKRCKEYKRRTGRDWDANTLGIRKVAANDDNHNQKRRGLVRRIVLGRLKTPRKRSA